MATKMTREEAINKVRQMNLPKETMEILEALVPELAESEDERIRKELKEAFEAYDIESTWNGIPIRSIFAWLEKQKEQNLIMANSPQLKEQKQGKIPPYVTGFKGDPDPAGTSDLEEAAKEYASKTLCDPDDGPSTGLAKESFIAGAEWQKEQKPAEWSEEDEDNLCRVIRVLEDNDSDWKELSNWLKSLRPSWKPSEEQMKALYDACCISFEEERDFHPSLSRLYHDLRKL